MRYEYSGIIEAMNGCLAHMGRQVYICHAIDAWAKSVVCSDKFAEKKAAHAKALIHRMLGWDNISLHGWIEMTHGIRPSASQMKSLRVRWVRKIITDLERMSDD